MIDALVKFGVKDQNVVLSTIEKIKKGKKDLAKKATVSFAEIKAGQSSKAATSTGASKEKQLAEKQLLADKKEITATERFTKAAGIAGSTLMGVARAASSLDPVAFIQGTLSAAGKAATAIPFLGNVAQGALELAGISVGAAGGAIGSAKQSTAGALEIEKRNATTNRYGQDIFRSESEMSASRELRRSLEERNAAALTRARAADTAQNTVPAWFETVAPGFMAATGKTREQALRAYNIGGSNEEANLRARIEDQYRTGSTSVGGASGWTPSDKAQFVQALSSAYGKVNAPLTDAIKELIKSGRNVEQFTQVAAGNWEALGTDEGAILQQITNSFSGALPSVKQSLQAELLKTHGDLIEKENPELARRRATSAAWAGREEEHTIRTANVAAANMPALLALDSKLKDVEIRLITGAQRLAAAVNDAANLLIF